MSDWRIPLRRYVLVGSLFLSGCVVLPVTETAEQQPQPTPVVEELAASDGVVAVAAVAGETKQASDFKSTVVSASATLPSQASQVPQPRQDMPPTDAISHWLLMAEQAFSKDYLTTPASDNAYAYYGRVLLQEPQNKQALVGLEKIVQRYLNLALSSQRKGKTKQAQLFLQRANKVVPRHKDIPMVQAELKRMAAGKSKAKPSPQSKQQRQVPTKFAAIQTQQQSVMEAPQGMQRQRILLPPSALTQEAPALAIYLRRLARQIEEVDGRLFIIAPQDKQVRWVYSLLNSTNPDYRIRANMKHKKTAAIEVIYRADEPVLDVFK